jgi:SNF2 family DNA or RNA helicase
VIQAAEHQVVAVKKFIGQDSCLIGDSMGTGKTLTAILLDREERRLNPHRFKTLIVCNKGGLSVWEWHLVDQGVDPSRICVIDPRDRVPFDEELRLGAPSYDYYIMHWDALRSLEYVTGPKAVKWDHLIADEVQFAKNRKAQRTKILKRVKAFKKTGCTGTPADNHPQDFWSILNWLFPRKFTSYWVFYDRYLDWEQHPYSGYRIVKGVKNIDELHKSMAPFYIRRKLTDVVDNMPPKTRHEVRVQLSPRQRKDYDSMHKHQVARIGERNEELVVTYKIAMFIRLQQMTLGTVELDWSDFDLGKAADPKIKIAEPSPKLDAAFEIIETAQDEDESIVVFTQFKDVVRLVVERCKRLKIPVSSITGEMSDQKKRDAQVASFQSGKTKVFVGTIGAAGTSITLTAAHTLMFTDRAWNPGVNEQAEDRIWRIGQHNACRIIDIVADDTIDDDRLRKIWEKARWVNEIVELPTHIGDVWGAANHDALAMFNRGA